MAKTTGTPFAHITLLRLQAQQLLRSPYSEPGRLVEFMGAMQSQDFNMALWAIGARLKQPTLETIYNAINKGEILRTHVLRPTWHFVSRNDISWMIDLTGPRIKNSSNARNKQLGLTSNIFARSVRVIGNALEKNGPMTRDELMSALAKAKINTGENRSSHILFNAELEKIICSGPMKEGKTTYALFSERVKTHEKLHRKEASARLAARYIQSHYPATARDLSWWSGLSLSEANAALNANDKKLQNESIAGEKYWMPVSCKLSSPSTTVRMLPAYDEFTISYKDRTPSLAAEHKSRVISINGIFNPLIVIDGIVQGMWKRNTTADHVKIEFEYFKNTRVRIKKLAEAEAEKYADFFGRKLQLSHRSA